jgi:hypothetical protein
MRPREFTSWLCCSALSTWFVIDSLGYQGTGAQSSRRLCDLSPLELVLQAWVATTRQVRWQFVVVKIIDKLREPSKHELPNCSNYQPCVVHGYTNWCSLKNAILKSLVSWNIDQDSGDSHWLNWFPSQLTCGSTNHLNLGTKPLRRA